LPRRCGVHPVREQRGLAGLQAWVESIGRSRQGKNFLHNLRLTVKK